MQLSPKLRKALSLLIVFTLAFQQAGFAQGLAQLDISRYLGNFSSNPLFRPVLLRYFSYNPLDDSFQLLLDKGTLKGIKTEEVKEQGKELLKYFLTGVALPDENFWVNLRPDSEDEIITEDLGKTDLGRVLLDADLKLKKDVATFTSPETAEGREYWDKLYKKAGELFSTSEITIPTLTRPWIVPGEVIIRESGNSAYVYKATLKVMLEQDYLQSPSSVIASPAGAKQSLYDTYSFKDPRLKELNEYSSQLIRELIIPKLTKEVNSSERYAPLRQVFFSLILSRWFKNKFAGTVSSSSLRGAAGTTSSLRATEGSEAISSRIDSGDLTGLTSKEPWSKSTYFEEYKKSFSSGEYNLKEQVNGIMGPVIRSYFSGGISILPGDLKIPTVVDPVSPLGTFKGSSPIVTAALGKGMVSITGTPNGEFLPVLENKVWAGIASPGIVGNSSSPITVKQINEALGKFNAVDWKKEIAQKHVFSFSKEDVLNEIRSFGPEGERFLEKALKAKEKILRGGKLTREERVSPEDRKFLEALLGGKGAHLFEMTLLGLNVPRGFTTTTRVTKRYYDMKQMEGVINSLTPEDYANMLPDLKQALDAAANDIKLYQETIDREEEEALKRLEILEGKELGDENDPLLISVRSGAEKSMPGMMDTVLNLGLNDKAVINGLKKMRDERFAYDTYRRFLSMFGNIVLKISKGEFDKLLDETKVKFAKRKNISLEDVKDINTVVKDIDLEPKDLESLIVAYKGLIKTKTGAGFPQEPEKQRKLTRDAVKDSSTGQRAMDYRRINRIALEDTISAVTYVVMKYGNIGSDSGTGVVFTRNPNTGEMVFEPGSSQRTLYGEFLTQAQGEDVVAGIRTPKSIIEMKEILPDAYKDLLYWSPILEEYYGNMQDIEFTVEKGVNHFLQARTGKRTARAEITIGVDQVKNGDITIEQSILRFKDDASRLQEVLFPQFDPKEMEAIRKGERPENRIIGEGLPAGPGAVVGRAVFSSEDAIRADKDTKEKYDRAKNAGASEVELARIKEEGTVILVTLETEPGDVRGMEKSGGILTARGGMTSHAAVVGRGMGKVVVVGAKIYVDEHNKKFIGADGTEVREGERFSLNGFTGEVIKGKVPTIPSIVIRGIDQERGIELKAEEKLTPEEQRFYDRFKIFYNWVKENKGIGVRANAEQLKDVDRSLSFGADGIGLYREEHANFDVEEEERLIYFQELLLADTPEKLQKALEKFIAFHKKDFVRVFIKENGKPVIVRLLDPPKHEFLLKKTDKNYEERIARLINMTGMTRKQIEDRIEELKEVNPMLGHRGIRLSFTDPEILEAEVTAMVEAAQEVEKLGIRVQLEIMVPLVSNRAEIKWAKEKIVKVASRLGYAREKYMIGTMVELVSAALLADQIAEDLDFISLGTNDLTQTEFEFSRDDSGNKAIPNYLERKILPDNPFEVLDEIAWKLAGIVVKKAKAVNPKIEIGICGEHGGNPVSVTRFKLAGLDYVSTSPYRVPIAYLQSAIDEILVKQGKPLPAAPEFRLLADEEVMKTPQNIKPIPTIKEASTIEEAVRQAVTLVEEGKITREEAIGNLDISELAGGLVQGLLENSDFQKILSWAKKIKSVRIESLVKNAQDIERLGRLFQAEGVFVQTENTFLDRIEATRRLIFADTDERRKAEMEKLAELQSGFYNALFDQQNLQGRAVTIRLFNLGLKSFSQGLTEKEISDLASYLGIDRNIIQKKIDLYFESNPDFANRSSRLALTLQPDLYRAQLRAIFKAIIEQGVSSEVNILAPFLIEAKESIAMKELIEEVANQVNNETGKKLKYKIIPAIATPRAALTAERFAQETDSAVIDTVELTDGVLGMTKADAQSFLPAYLKEKIYPADPYESIYQEAVGLLLREAVLRARPVNPDMKFSVRGYDNDPASLEFFHQAGVDTIIASPENLDLAILSAAQAAIKFPRPAASSAVSDKILNDTVEYLADLTIKYYRIAEPQVISEDLKTEIRRFLLEEGNDFRFSLGKAKSNQGPFVSVSYHASDGTVYRDTSVEQGLMKMPEELSRLLAQLDQQGKLNKYISSPQLIEAQKSGSASSPVSALQEVVDYVLQSKGGMPELTKEQEATIANASLEELDDALQTVDTIITIYHSNMIMGPQTDSTPSKDDLEELEKYDSLNDLLKRARIIAAQQRGSSSPVSALQRVVDEILKDTNTGQLSLTINQREVITNALPEERSEVIRVIESRIIGNIGVPYSYKGYNFEDIISQVPLSVIERPFIKRARSLRRTILRDAAQSKTASLAQTQLNSGSSPMTAPETTDVGGIDFTAIPWITQPMGNMSGLNFSLSKLSNVENINLDDELLQIQNMLRAGISPSEERLKEFVAACYQKGELKTYLEGIVTSVVDTLKLQEERVEVTSNSLKEVMLLVEAVI